MIFIVEVIIVLNAIIGILLLITFIGLVVYVMKGGNIMIGFLVMSILWAIIGGIPINTAVNDIFSKSAEAYGATIVVIVFGSWFGRVLVDTGIASDISQQTVRVSYKHPIIALILICLVTAFIFTSSYGVGAVIAIAVILLPIMESLGVKKNIAVTLFVMSIGAPMYVNIVIIKQIQLFFPKVAYGPRYLTWAFAAMGAQMLVVLLIILLNARSIHRNETKQPVIDKSNHQHHISKITYILPILPVIMNIAFKWQPIPGLMLSIFLALLLTGHINRYKKSLDFVNQTITTSIKDIAGLIIMLLFLAMFSATAVKVTARFSKLFSAIIPRDPVIIAIAFAILAPLALFHGPLMVWGAGSATAAVLAGTGFFNQYFAFALIIAPAVSMAVSCCITQSWNLWVVNHVHLDVKTFLKTGIPYGWLACALNFALAVMMLA